MGRTVISCHNKRSTAGIVLKPIVDTTGYFFMSMYANLIDKQDERKYY